MEQGIPLLCCSDPVPTCQTTDPSTGRLFQGESLFNVYPRAKAPGLTCLAAARRSTRQPLA
jgi:hypothetical protein